MGSVWLIKCCICTKRFPNTGTGIQVNSVSSCICCATDKHIPKLYSTSNNMDPGAVSIDLSGGIYIISINIKCTLCHVRMCIHAEVSLCTFLGTNSS